MRRRLSRLAVVLSLFVPACGAGLPSAADEAALVTYGDMRHTCIEQAAAVKGDAADDGAAFRDVYKPCADRVDRTFGMDGGSR